MFKFLKEKLKASIKSISEKIRKEKEVVEGPKEEVKERPLEEVTKGLPKEEIKEGSKEAIKVEKKGIFSKLKETLTTTKINEERFDELFQELEMSLLENNVAYEVIDKIKEDLKKALVNQPIKRGKIEDTILNSLKESLKDILIEPKKDLMQL